MLMLTVFYVFVSLAPLVISSKMVFFTVTCSKTIRRLMCSKDESTIAALADVGRRDLRVGVS